MALKYLGAGISGKGGIVSNVADFQDALKEYVRVRNKSTYDSVLEKMQNIAYKAAQNTQFSDRDKIRASIASLPNKGDTKARSGSSQYVGQYKLINWQRKLIGLPTLGGSGRRTKYITPPGGMVVIEKKKKNKSRAGGLGVNYFMDGKYKAFNNARSKGSKWLRIGWALAAEKLGKPFGRGDFGPATKSRLSGRAYGGGADIKQLGEGKYEFMIYNGVGIFDHRYKKPGGGALPIRSANDISRARAIQEQGLRMALVAEIKNMGELILSRTSAIWNGKRVKVKAI